MAGFIQCNYGGGGGPVEVITGSVTSTTGGDFTVTSQQGKAPKRVQVWRTDGTTALCFFNSAYTGKYVRVSFNGGLAANNAGNADAYTCGIKTVGATSVTISYPTNATYGNAKPFDYSVEFE